LWAKGGKIIKRDSYGQVLSVSGEKYEYEYKYDSTGNWIELVEYSVIKNDIEIRQKERIIKRTITYY